MDAVADNAGPRAPEFTVQATDDPPYMADGVHRRMVAAVEDPASGWGRRWTLATLRAALDVLASDVPGDASVDVAASGPIYVAWPWKAGADSRP